LAWSPHKPTQNGGDGLLCILSSAQSPQTFLNSFRDNLCKKNKRAFSYKNVSVSGSNPIKNAVLKTLN